MSEKLVIDNEITRWVPALKAVKNGEHPICPICNSSDTKVEKSSENEVGFVLITCNKCKKSGYFSRVISM